MSKRNGPNDPRERQRLLWALLGSALVHGLLLLWPIRPPDGLPKTEQILTVWLHHEIMPPATLQSVPEPALPQEIAPPPPPQPRATPRRAPPPRPPAATTPQTEADDTPTLAALVAPKPKPPTRVCRPVRPVPITPEVQRWIDEVQAPKTAAYFAYMRTLMGEQAQELLSRYPPPQDAKCSVRLAYEAPAQAPGMATTCSDPALESRLSGLLAQQPWPRPDGYPIFVKAVQVEFYFLGGTARADVMQGPVTTVPQELCE